jgi:zinc transport system substrate-binding protein
MRTLPALLLSLSLTACASGAAGSDDGPVEVTAAFYPYAFLVERIGADDVALTTLTRPGAEPHDLELTPQQVGGLGESDLVVYAAGFQPAVDEAVGQQAQDKAFDVNAVTELVPGYVPLEDGELEPEEEGTDPHVWLDPTRYAQIAQALAERLGEVDPKRASAYEQRAAALTAELQALDEEMSAGLQTCQRREIVTSHNAFGYLADRYDLEQIAVTGITPEEEPTPRRLADVARLAEEHGVTTVFFEELVSPRTAESLAREVGAKAVVLSPLEGPPETGDYLSAMRENLATLRTALGCT